MPDLRLQIGKSKISQSTSHPTSFYYLSHVIPMDDLHGITKKVGETKSEPSAVKRQYDLDPEINEVIDKLNRLDIRSPGSLEEFITILRDCLKEMG